MFLNEVMSDVSIRTDEITIDSAFLNREVSCVLYLPDMPNVIEPLHLLVLNDGQDLETMKYGKILQRLYKKKKIRPVLTVGVKAGERTQEYGVAGQPDFKGRGAVAEAYSRFIMEELLPAIYARTNVSEFASTAIAGFSLGALSAFDLAWNHPEVFTKVGAFSGSFWWRSKSPGKKNPDKNRIAHKMVNQGQAKPGMKFWFMAGTKEEESDRNGNGIIDVIDDTTSLIWELCRKGYDRFSDIGYVELIGGRHDVPTWGKMMPKFLLWAFGK